VGLLVLGGSFYGFKMSSADVPMKLPTRNAVNTELDRLSALTAPAVQAVSQAIPQALASSAKANTMPLLRLTAREAPATARPATLTMVPQPVNDVAQQPAHRVNTKTVRRAAQPAHPCVRVYPELGKCH
jgi:hypothetical protein